jgi:hypothetical protein
MSAKLPPRDVIAERIETQRRRVFWVQAICSITSAAAADFAESGSIATSRRFAENAWNAMEGVAELLDSIAGKLESDVVLALPEPGEENEGGEVRP